MVYMYFIYESTQFTVYFRFWRIFKSDENYLKNYDLNKKNCQINMEYFFLVFRLIAVIIKFVWSNSEKYLFKVTVIEYIQNITVNRKLKYIVEHNILQRCNLCNPKSFVKRRQMRRAMFLSQKQSANILLLFLTAKATKMKMKSPRYSNEQRLCYIYAINKKFVRREWWMIKGSYYKGANLIRIWNLYDICVVASISRCRERKCAFIRTPQFYLSLPLSSYTK